MQQNLDHPDGSPADLGTFRNAWAVELPWIVLAKSEALFTGCSVCLYLQNLLESTPRDQRDIIAAIKHRLGRHFSFQGAQRIAIAKIQESARRSDGDEWLLGSEPVQHFALFASIIVAVRFFF